LCPEVVFCFDGDEAGRKAAFRALEATLPCLEDGRQARFLFLPEGQDPDDAVRSGGQAAFEQLLDDAMPLDAFLFDAVAKGLDMGSLDGRARMSKRALPYIRQLPEGVFRQLMFQALAQRTGLELDSLMKLEAPPPPSHSEDVPREDVPADYDAGFDDEPLRGSPPVPPVAARPTHEFKHQVPARGYSNLAQSAIALLLHQPDIARLVSQQQLDEVEGEDEQLLKDLLQLLHRRPESSTAMLLGHWYGTAEGMLLSRLAGQERLIPATGIEQQFVDTIHALARLPHQSKLTAQVDKLKLTNYAEVSEQEKQRLRELLQEKRQRDALRNKPGE
jgi:DNA primase